MKQLNYQLVVNSDHHPLPLSTKRNVDQVVKGLEEVINPADLQIKIEELPNTKFLVSMKAQTSVGSILTKKEGRKIIPLLKKVKKSILRKLRESRKKRKVPKRHFRRRLAIVK